MLDNLIGKRYVHNDTQQIALTTIVKHDLKKLNSSQYFFKEGSLAILPISKNSFSLVWSLNKSLNLKNADDLIKKKLKIILGPKKKFNLSTVDSFPISLKFNVNCTKKNILILGEGSYSIHPIAGQGYNLILRDIKTLYKEIQNFLSVGMQLKDSHILNNFVNMRKPENFLFGIGIDFINRFCNKLNIKDSDTEKISSICRITVDNYIISENTPPSIAAGCIFYFTKKNNMITLTRRPLSQMEMIDLMIYGEDVVTNETDQINTKNLTDNNLRNQNV